MISVLLEEGDGLVVSVELGGVSAHEDITDNDVLEVIWEVSTHDAHDALLAFLLPENVVLLGESIVDAIEGEGDIGKALDTSAILGDLDALDERSDDAVGSHDEGSAGVDGGLVTGGILGTVGASHGVESDVPVGLLDNLMLLDDGVAQILIDTWDDHVGIPLLGFLLKIEGEGLLGEIGFLNEGGETINGDGVEGKTNDTVHLGDEESGTLDLLDLTEAHGGVSGITDVGVVTGDVTLDGARAVGDVEILTIGLVGGGGVWVVLRVGLASDGVAVAGVNPEVGGTGVWDNSELLPVRAELDFDEVLGVHVVLHVDMLASGTVELSSLLDLGLLAHPVSDGERVVLERNSVSGDNSDKSGNESSGVHLFFSI